MSYKVLIASAGVGERLKAYTSRRNKGLVTLGLKPALSHIIDKFRKDLEFVVAVGYDRATVKSVLTVAHPDTNFTFVDVDRFEGEGSGLGYSLLKCEQFVQSPFIFIPNDTIIQAEDIDLDPNKHGNWLGGFNNENGVVDPSHYRCIETVENVALNILPKGIHTQNVYIGLCGIKDYADFWASMRSSSDATEEGESFGINRLDQKKVKFFSGWFDTGNLQSLETAIQNFRPRHHNILPKKSEAIWIYEDKCIKFHSDKKFISDRLKRIAYLPEDLIPKVTSSGVNYFAYKFTPGYLLSSCYDLNIFECFLDQMEEKIWSVRSENGAADPNLLVEFYETKTKQRVQDYLDRFDQKDTALFVNGLSVPTVTELLSQLDWQDFFAGAIWGRFHGDLHGENVIVQADGKIKLLDWRQNFGEGNYEFGDVYYDLGKILHGLIVRHAMVSQNRFSVEFFTKDRVHINIDTDLLFVEQQRLFEKWMCQKGYDFKRVEIITALIFLNIAALHHFPYSKFLFLLGKFKLQKVLKDG
jgi:hypothetical protein